MFRIYIHWVRIRTQPKISIRIDKDLESGSGSKLLLNNIWKKYKLLHNFNIFSSKEVIWKIECGKFCDKKKNWPFLSPWIRFRIQKTPESGSGSRRPVNPVPDPKHWCPLIKIYLHCQNISWVNPSVRYFNKGKRENNKAAFSLVVLIKTTGTCTLS